MAVGTLNVAVTASTRKAQQELQAFRLHVRGVANDVKNAGAAFAGNTIGEYMKKFGGGGTKPPAPPTGDLNTFRSAVVNLTRDTKRYNNLAVEQVGLFKGMKQSLNQLKGTLAGAVAGAVAFNIGLNFGQKIREITEGINSWKDAQQQLLHVITGSESIQEEYNNRMSRLQTILDAQGRAASDRATAERKEIEAVREQTKEYKRKTYEIEQGKRLTERLIELEEGLRRAKEINNPYMAEDVRARFDAARHFADAEKRQEEAKEAAQKAKRDREEKARKEEQAAERRRQVARREEEALEELRKENRQFAMTDSERRRDDISREIKDPARQRAAMLQLDEIEAGEAAKRHRAFVKHRLELLRDSGGNSIAATGANTREGFAQRVRFGNQNRVDKIAADQLRTQRLMEGHLRTIAARPSIELEAANIGN